MLCCNVYGESSVHTVVWLWGKQFSWQAHVKCRLRLNLYHHLPWNLIHYKKFSNHWLIKIDFYLIFDVYFDIYFELFKDDFQSVLRSLGTLMFINIVSLTRWNAIDAIRYETHTLSLRPFKFFFQQPHWFLQLRSCFIKWYEKERSITLRIHNGGWHETLSLLHVSSCEMLHFVTSYTSQNRKRRQALERA